MKSLGDQILEYMQFAGVNSAELAARVGTSRQSLENTWRQGVQTPRYLQRLAQVMGTTADTLLAGKYKPGSPTDSRVDEIPTKGGVTMEIEQAIRVVAAELNALRGPQRAMVQAALHQLVDNPAGAGEVADEVSSVLARSRAKSKRVA